MFSVRTTPEKCKNATITGHFGKRLKKLLFRDELLISRKETLHVLITSWQKE